MDLKPTLAHVWTKIMLWTLFLIILAVIVIYLLLEFALLFVVLLTVGIALQSGTTAGYILAAAIIAIAIMIKSAVDNR